MHVAVTGAGGYIGSVAVERLIENGHEVLALDSFERGHRAAVHPSAETIQVDLRDLDSVTSAFRGRQIDAVFHFAALHLVPESVDRPSEYYRNNLLGGLNLLDAVRSTGVPRFVFSSTAAVYGEPTVSPIVEETLKMPINPYGRSKWMLEQILTDFAERYGLAHAAFRYFNVAGATVERGEDHRPETHVIPMALLAVAGKRDAFKIFGTDYPTPDGTAIRDYVHVSDLADAHVTALTHLDDGSLGAVNLGTRGGFSVRQVADAVARVTGQAVPLVESPRRAGDPPSLIADASRAGAILGWEPSRSNLDDMIGSAWEWMQRHPNGYRD